MIVEDLVHLHRLKSLSFEACHHIRLLLLPPSIEKLCLSGFIFQISHNSPRQSHAIQSADFPALRALEIDWSERLPGGLSSSISLRRESLTHVSFRRTEEKFFTGAIFSDVPVETASHPHIVQERPIPLPLSALTDLKMRECNVSDRTLERLALCAPRLESLDLSANPSLTGVGVVAMVRKAGAKLRDLDLTNCRGVSPDTVAWARGEGVKVTYRFPDSRSGKKLRV